MTVHGQNVTVRERKWLETEEEGVHYTYWEQGDGMDMIIARFRNYVVQGRVIEEGGRIQIDSPPDFNASMLVKISPEEANELDLKDPVEAPPSPYKVQPENQEKLVFISGPPGAGKSSIAAWLALNADYVYYEGDGFMFGLNPYTPANASEPSLAAQVQHPLLGQGMHKRKDLIDRFGGNFNAAMGDYSKVDRSLVDEFITALADDITNERRRLGGNWIIAFAVPDVMSRNMLRSLLGKDLVFMVLTLSPELQKERLADRNLGDDETIEMLSSIYKLYQPAGDEEERAIGFEQKSGDSIEKNSEEVLRLINEYYESEKM